MIPHREHNTVITNGNAGKAFSLSASAEAFAILSSGIYENKIRAVIRELSCNAFDAHVAAGKSDDPFEVILPSRMEPTFTVKDQGIGLSHDDVMNLYSTYFASTKQETNELIGAKGLGSKSPFSYTSQFNVISVFNGVKSMYNAYVGEDGTPSITCVHSSDTNEPNGVTVSMGVEPDDIYEFQQEARETLKWFEKTPTIKNSDFAIESVVPNDRDYFFVNADSIFDRKATAWMGNVAYDVSSEFMSIVSDSDDHRRLVTTLHAGKNIVIKFGLGELDTAASRETLSFDPETRKNFDAKAKQCIERMKTDIQKEIDSVESPKKLIDSPHRNLFNSGLFTYKGRDFSSMRIRFTDGVARGKDDKFKDLLLKRVTMARVHSRSSSTFYTVLQPWEDKVRILVTDINKHIRHNQNEMFSGGETLFTVNPDQIELAKELFEDFDVSIEYLSKRVENGCVPEKKPRQSSGGGARYKAQIVEHGTSEIFGKLKMSELTDIAANAKKEGKAVVVWKQGFNESVFSGYMDMLNQNLFKKGVIGIRVSEKIGDKLIENHDCINMYDSDAFFGLIHDEVKAAIEQQDNHLNKIRTNEIVDYSLSSVSHLIAAEDGIGLSEFGKQFDSLKKLNDLRCDMAMKYSRNYLRLVDRLCGDKIKPSLPVIGQMEASKFEDELNALYPCLKGILRDNLKKKYIEDMNELHNLRKEVATSVAA